MLQKPKCPIIALEEHYADDELIATYTGLDVNPVPAIVARLQVTATAVTSERGVYRRQFRAPKR